MNTLIEVMRARRSIRKFKPDAPITQEQIDLLMEAAMLAPSACNLKAWEFVVVRDKATLAKIADTHPYAKMCHTASLAVIVCALPEIQKDIAEGYFPQDCAAATENILLQAAAMGLGACWCGVYPRDKYVADFKALLDIESLPFNVIAVGVPDENPDPRGGYDKNKVRYIG